MSEPVVSTESLTREFGETTALDGVDVDIEGAQIVGVAGPNGSGKTTLIRCLLGLLAPTAGECSLGGTSSTALGPGDRRRVGYMPQENAVYRDLTVGENVRFFGSLYGVADQEAVADALAFVDLADRADSRIGALSGGMLRRTSLACALVHDPDLLFLDEPTVGLDPGLRASMWDGFRERRDDGALVVVSTHYLDEVSRCDRVLFLRQGRVLALGSPAGLLDRTGADDMEGAFLSLVDSHEGSRPGGDADTTGGGRGGEK